MSVIKHIVVHSKPFLPTFQVIDYRISSWPYPQTLDKSEKACRGQTLQLIMDIRKLLTYLGVNAKKTFPPSHLKS